MDDLRLESEPETSALNQVFKLEGKLLFDARFVLVFGGINDKTAAIICRQLLAMDHDKVAPIRMLISSPGGHVESGDAIHDMIKFIRSPVTTIGSGWVASAGTHIFLAAPKERRLCLPNTRFMIDRSDGRSPGNPLRWSHSGNRPRASGV